MTEQDKQGSAATTGSKSNTVVLVAVTAIVVGVVVFTVMKMSEPAAVAISQPQPTVYSQQQPVAPPAPYVSPQASVAVPSPAKIPPTDVRCGNNPGFVYAPSIQACVKP